MEQSENGVHRICRFFIDSSFLGLRLYAKADKPLRYLEITSSQRGKIKKCLDEGMKPHRLINVCSRVFVKVVKMERPA